MIPDIHKTVIVTGGSQGIGAGLVKAFLDRRYNVVATSRSITKTGEFKVMPESISPKRSRITQSTIFGASHR
jgi:NAD(P)-dependent dehydrogenase (short-subunit alcohol dehydrogenase family)